MRSRQYTDSKKLTVSSRKEQPKYYSDRLRTHQKPTNTVNNPVPDNLEQRSNDG